MTSKELAEVAGITAKSINCAARSLFPGRIVKGRKTIFTEEEAFAIMRKVNKKKFVQPKLNERSRLAKLNVQVANDVDRKAILSIAQNVERLVNSFNDRLSKLEAKEYHPMLRLENKPQMQTQLSFFDPRQRVNNLVNQYHFKTKKKFPTIWGNLYSELKIKTGFDVTRRLAIDGCSLDFVEEQGYMDRLEEVAKSYFQ